MPEQLLDDSDAARAHQPGGESVPELVRVDISAYRIDGGGPDDSFNLAGGQWFQSG